jgi:hypothetical protein
MALAASAGAIFPLFEAKIQNSGPKTVQLARIHGIMGCKRSPISGFTFPQ